MLESEFQSKFVKRVQDRFPQIVAIKNDPVNMNGFPDYTFLYGKAWALVEFKESKDASFRPNQKEYIQLADEMSFGRVAYPENAKAVFNELCNFLEYYSGVKGHYPFHNPFTSMCEQANKLMAGGKT